MLTDWQEQTKLMMEACGDKPEDFEFMPRLYVDKNNYVKVNQWYYES